MLAALLRIPPTKRFRDKQARKPRALGEMQTFMHSASRPGFVAMNRLPRLAGRLISGLTCCCRNAASCSSTSLSRSILVMNKHGIEITRRRSFSRVHATYAFGATPCGISSFLCAFTRKWRGFGTKHLERGASARRAIRRSEAMLIATEFVSVNSLHCRLWRRSLLSTRPHFDKTTRHFSAAHRDIFRHLNP